MKEAISVSKLNRFIKDMFTQTYLLNSVLVKGEISNFKEARGNYYFSLKDESSSVQCIMFSNYALNNDGMHIDEVKDGMEVTVTGRVSVYEKAGTYAIYVNKIENSGLGEYFIKLEELKKKLAEKGMFDESYKKPIPRYSMNIGVVTAQTGAAIKDIVKTIKNKNPYANIYLYPSLVQGENAYQTIVDGIMTLDKMRLDVIIIGRGGGSIEDLYCFNDERVAYAIFNASTPIISAVGHEINDSISDLVADLRVATPTAAGEAATFSYQDYEDTINLYKEKLEQIIVEKFDDLKERLENYRIHIDLLAPKAKLGRYKDNLSHKRDELRNIINIKLQKIKSDYERYLEMLKSRDVLKKLGNGLSYVTNENGKKIKSIKEVKIGQVMFSRFSDGTVKSKVYEKG